ncbi:MAG: selenocysteine-specific translation factor [Acidobacteria bacterium]|nr:MAG: selenocysteine-specific translation factor [Acidobacteriota bacterium]
MLRLPRQQQRSAPLYCSRMKSVIVGTAGHIDHGKTALVKALTGIDADRLEEEKRRGITIDIGFAHLDLPGPDGEIFRLGFVDVPGHERFVRNMLAGIGGIDLVLLVIAADESIKPQTREHFDICRQLSVSRGITVLTRSDLVDRETLDVVRLEVEDFLRGSFLDASMASEVPAKDSTALARLPIDRVFTMKGFGPVVTGTLVTGSIRKDEELEVFPQGQRVRVRGVQVHGQPAEQALAGQRTALNLAGVAKADLERGKMLAPAATFHSTRRAEVSLSLLPSAKPLKDHARVHLHVYTSETIAQIVLHEQKQIASGETAFANLHLADPLLLLPGDRFIIRQFSPVITIGGGIVLDAWPLPRPIKHAQASFLKILVSNNPPEILKARIARRSDRGLSFAQAIAETGMRRELIEKHLADPTQKVHVLRAGDLLIQTAAIEAVKLALTETVSEFHRRNPLVAGMSKEALREKLDVGPEVFDLAVTRLVADKKLEVIGEFVRLPGHSVIMKDEEAESKKTIESAFASAGLKVPALKDVLAGLKVDRTRAQKIVTLLLRDKVLVKISEDLVFHRDALESLRKRMTEQKTTTPKMDVARFKDFAGVSRKYAIPLLEYLDREHVTRRVGDERVIL